MKSHVKIGEEDFHMNCWKFIQFQYPKLIQQKRIFHVPNGGKRITKTNSKGQTYSPEAIRFKKMGVTAGIPDFLILKKTGMLAAIELKVEGGVISNDQKEVHLQWQLLGIEIHVVWNFEEFKEALKLILNN